MSLAWTPERPAYWNADKVCIIGEAPAGIFDSRFRACKQGDVLPGQWWRVTEDGSVVGYGWLDVNWGDAEITLATAPGDRGRGVGAFVLERLEAEARRQGLNYLYNVVRATHPTAGAVSEWLCKHGFTQAEDGRLLRAVPKRG